MKTPEKIKKFAEEYFQIDINENLLPVYVAVLDIDDYFDDMDKDGLHNYYYYAMIDKEQYISFLKDILENNNIEDATLINLFKKINTSELNDLNVNNADMIGLEDTYDYCGWVIKKDCLDEIVYVKHGAW